MKKIIYGLLTTTCMLHSANVERRVPIRFKIGTRGILAKTKPVGNISPRSAGTNLPRQVVATRNIERELACSDKCWPGYIGSTFTFSKSFNSPSIANCLFGNALINNGCCRALRVTGSRVAGRDSNHDLLADYFGLPTDFVSTLNFSPRIVNTLNDYQLYMRLDRFMCGSWLYVHAPVVHTQWNLNLCEDVARIGTSGYSEGYFSADPVTRANLLPNASAFFNGATPNIAGQKFNGLRFARISGEPCTNHTKTQLANLEFWLGYDLLQRNHYTLSTGLIVVAPTGNRSEARYLFEPIVGNGHHWELGALIRGDALLWQNCDQTQSLRLFTQGNITHMFNARQRRTFDLKDNELSRYILAEKLGPNNDFPFLGGSTFESFEFCSSGDELVAYQTAIAQFANEYTPVANLTTLCVDVSVGYQIDWVAMFTWTNRNFTWDLGYNIWARSCERIKPVCCNGNLITPNTWALKGTAPVYGFIGCDNEVFTLNQPLALSATDSQATIFASNGIDHANFAYGANSATNPTAFSLLSVAPDSAVPSFTSKQPIFLSDADIDICGAQTKGLSNTIFTHVSYQWDCTCWQPYVGIGGEAEFGSGHHVKCSGTSCNTGTCSSSNCSTSASCSTGNGCSKCSISQWSLWIKGGFVFG
jgi:hypothetical protein